MTKKILIFAGPEGHFSLAEAAKQALDAEYDVQIFVRPEKLFTLYKPIYRFFPAFFKVIFSLFNTKLFLNLAQWYCRVTYDHVVKQAMEQYQPDTCIITYFMYNQSVERHCQQHHIPLFGVVSDPWTFHPITIAPTATANLVFDQYALDKALQLIPATYLQTGWLVKDAYEQLYDQKAVREHLKLKSDVFTILIASGSEGSTTVMKVLPSLLNSPQPLQVFVACGHNQQMYNKVLKLANHGIIPLSFTDKLHLYMQAADIVVGKAGPNMVFEAVAALKPFFAITHISGQEDGNLDLIKHYKLGFVEESAEQAAQLLQDIIADPQQLAYYQPTIKQMAEYNQHAKTQLKTLIAEAVK